MALRKRASPALEHYRLVDAIRLPEEAIAALVAKKEESDEGGIILSILPPPPSAAAGDGDHAVPPPGFGRLERVLRPFDKLLERFELAY